MTLPFLMVACGGSGPRGTQHPDSSAPRDAPAVGGERGTGGITGTGGALGSGGAGVPTGGAGGTAETLGTGGAMATGGKVGTGGGVGTGGVLATGGKASTGGVGTGGAAATGGGVGTGGATTTGGGVATGGRGGTGGLSGTGGTGAALGGTGGADPSTPILARPVRSTYACSVAAPVAELALGDGTWSSTQSSLLFTAAKYWAGRWDMLNNNLELELSSIGFDGTLGAVTTLAQEYYGSQNSDLAVVERDGNIALVWVGGAIGGSQTLKLAQVLPSGAVQTSPTSIVGTEGTWLNLPRLLATSGGFLLSWVEGTTSAHRLHVAQLSATGSLVGAPTTLWDPGARIVGAAFVALGDGSALVVSSTDVVGTTTNFQYFALDSAGAPRAPSVRLSGFSSLPRMLAQGERLLLGWSDGADRGVVRLARFDALGQAVGATVALQSPPAAGRQNMPPSLVDLDGDVAIAWSEGHSQRSVTDYEDVHMNFVIVDGDDLVPLSPTIEVASPKSGTGVYGQAAVRNGLDFLVLSRIASHLYGRTASVGIRCSQ